MLLNISERLELEVPIREVWALLRDVPRLTLLVPGVEKLEIDESASEEAYVAYVTEKIGPFRLSMRLGIRVVEVVESELLKAELQGGDTGGKNRVKGVLTARLEESEASKTVLDVDASIEVLGKMASLGAVPIRRRSKEKFSEFARRIAQGFSGS